VECIFLPFFPLFFLRLLSLSLILVRLMEEFLIGFPFFFQIFPFLCSAEMFKKKREGILPPLFSFFSFFLSLFFFFFLLGSGGRMVH